MIALPNCKFLVEHLHPKFDQGSSQLPIMVMLVIIMATGVTAVGSRIVDRVRAGVLSNYVNCCVARLWSQWWKHGWLLCLPAWRRYVCKRQCWGGCCRSNSSHWQGRAASTNGSSSSWWSVCWVSEVDLLNHLNSLQNLLSQFSTDLCFSLSNDSLLLSYQTNRLLSNRSLSTLTRLIGYSPKSLPLTNQFLLKSDLYNLPSPMTNFWPSFTSYLFNIFTLNITSLTSLY